MLRQLVSPKESTSGGGQRKTKQNQSSRGPRPLWHDDSHYFSPHRTQRSRSNKLNFRWEQMCSVNNPCDLSSQCGCALGVFLSITLWNSRLFVVTVSDHQGAAWATLTHVCRISAVKSNPALNYMFIIRSVHIVLILKAKPWCSHNVTRLQYKWLQVPPRPGFLFSYGVFWSLFWFYWFSFLCLHFSIV